MKSSVFKLIAVMLALAFVTTGLSAVTFADSQHVSGEAMSGISYEFDETFPYPYGNSIVGTEYLLSINGQIAYCLDYGTHLSFEAGYSERQSQTTYAGLSETNKELIQLAMHFGYSGSSFADMTPHSSYFVTQVLIWLISSGHFNAAAEADIINVFFENVANGKEKYAELKSKINNAKLYPSFNGQAVDLLYDSTADTYSATITDTNGVLQYYAVTDASGTDSATINTSDNTLTVETSNPGTVKITMERSFTPASIVFWVDNVNSMQTLITADANSNNTLQATVSVRATPLESITIEKRGEKLSRADISDTDFGQLYKPVFEEKPLAGVVFQIILQDDVTYTENGVLVTKTAGTVLCEITTGADGKATSPPIPMNVNYIIREKFTPNGFLPKEDIEFYHQYSKFLDTFKVNNARQKISISFKKSMELGIGKTQQPYDEVVFGVFTKESMTAGADTIPANSLVALITPDSSGNAECKDLPAGKYYLKELKTAQGYILNGREYQFELSYDDSGDSEIEISINNGNPIENDIIKGKGKVKKTDRSGKGLAGAVFHVYTEDNYFVAEVVSDANGNTAEVELSYGRYYWVETKAPDGCNLDKTKYYFEIKDNGFVYETTIKNYYSNPKTGDENDVILWVSLAFCSALIMWGANKRRKFMLRKLR